PTRSACLTSSPSGQLVKSRAVQKAVFLPFSSAWPLFSVTAPCARQMRTLTLMRFDDGEPGPSATGASEVARADRASERTRAPARATPKTAEQFAERIEKLAHAGGPLTQPQMARLIGGADSWVSTVFLRQVRVVPWVKCSRTDDGRLLFEIDTELRDLCEGRRPRPELNGYSVNSFLKKLREGIRERRLANEGA